MKYCESIFKTKRWRTREVLIGKVGVGGANPIRIQSMTTSNTRDAEATATQIMRLADVGCEIARVTVQGIKEAESCETIKNILIQKGYDIPLVADIHFYPPAAMKVVDCVDKVRVNPGNFVDKRASFKVIEYDDISYEAELSRIEEIFSPLVEKCKRLKRAMRIGTNHGSLSDRIMNRYGDTAFGMVESALEFARVCRKFDFHDIIFSMKASNPLVMIQAYRLLVKEMIQLGWNYPLHLGVTEAGEGEDGRVKSAIGIGALLLDGIGDTIRVSLTEDPWQEIDPCQRLVNFAQQSLENGIDAFEETHRSIMTIQRRPLVLSSLPVHRDGTVIVSAKNASFTSESLGCKKGARGVETADFVLVEKGIESLDPRILQESPVGFLYRNTLNRDIAHATPVIAAQDASMISDAIDMRWVLEIQRQEDWELLKIKKPSFVLFNPRTSRLHEGRQFSQWLKDNHVQVPIILSFDYSGSWEDLVIQAAAECGSLLIDGIGDGICLQAPHDLSMLRALSFNILQAVRMRTSRTEFISCPGCGRTLFDLQMVTKRIRARTSHLPGVKIAIMGCIVNGPGEMADADFGYVGSKSGKIDLYIGKQCVEKDIDFSEADEHLISLIKAHGRWQEPSDL